MIKDRAIVYLAAFIIVFGILISVECIRENDIIIIIKRVETAEARMLKVESDVQLLLDESYIEHHATKTEKAAYKAKAEYIKMKYLEALEREEK